MNEATLSVSTEDGGEAAISIEVRSVVRRGETARLYKVAEENLTGGIARYRWTVATSGECELLGFPTVDGVVPSSEVIVEVAANTPRHTAHSRDVVVPTDCRGTMALHFRIVDDLVDAWADATISFEIR